jgi:hypothetical protein
LCKVEDGCIVRYRSYGLLDLGRERRGQHTAESIPGPAFDALLETTIIGGVPLKVRLVTIHVH